MIIKTDTRQVRLVKVKKDISGKIAKKIAKKKKERNSPVQLNSKKSGKFPPLGGNDIEEWSDSQSWYSRQQRTTVINVFIRDRKISFGTEQKPLFNATANELVTPTSSPKKETAGRRCSFPHP